MSFVSFLNNFQRNQLEWEKKNDLPSKTKRKVPIVFGIDTHKFTHSYQLVPHNLPQPRYPAYNMKSQFLYKIKNWITTS